MDPTPPVIAQSPLFAALTRDLDEPLASVLAMIDLLERQSLGADTAECVDALRESGRRMERVLADARDLADLAAGRLALVDQDFSVRLLVDDLQARWSGPEKAVSSVLAAYEGDGELAARGDAERIGQVFDALVGRAAGRIRGPVEASLTARAQDGRVRLSGRIRDDGRAPADPAALFDLHAAGGGSLALTLAAALLARMGGTIEARGNPGAGLTVAFELDLPEAALAQPTVAEDAREDRPSLHVLIVDDNATNRLVAEAFCDMFGCTSDSAEDGMEALEAVGVRRYDLILMDVKMPRMDGIDATRAIRARHGPESKTPIIALTANADPEDIRRYVAAGMAGIVEKPIKAERLAEVLNAVLEAREAPATPARRSRAA
jgi:CheY-like chemotaxis protein